MESFGLNELLQDCSVVDVSLTHSGSSSHFPRSAAVVLHYKLRFIVNNSPNKEKQ